MSLNHSQNSLSTIPGWFVKFLNISLLVILLVLPAGCGSAPEPPNLVLVSLDTLRADRLGCYGYQRDTSPKLDLFAADSVLFEYAVSQANETVRSHRSLFTSIYPTESLSRRDRRLMADTLREAGFATGGFTDGGPMGKDYGFHQGFDEFAEWGHGIEMKCRQALKWLDVLPTIYDQLGIDIPADAAGMSLLPLLTGDREERGGGPLLSEGLEVGHYSVIEDGHKLIRRPDRAGYELYDLEKDPLERVNLAAREQQLVARMSRVMLQHHQALLALPRSGPPKAPRPGEQLDPRTVERLRQLGYLENP